PLPYPLSLHDALPISAAPNARTAWVSSGSLSDRQGSSPSHRGRTSATRRTAAFRLVPAAGSRGRRAAAQHTTAKRSPRPAAARRSEEHTSELQSLAYL